MDFTSSCWRCATEFTDSVPRALCPPCRPLFAAEQQEALAKFYLEHPDAPMPGDQVRLRTDEDRAFERDVQADITVL